MFNKMMSKNFASASTTHTSIKIVQRAFARVCTTH